ncbi:hypothetical protein QVD17_36124 [Tagetes erecta]|uniref:Uncharacterized protein n=1 Tax=Tagetes erecta TaxID=13708 RepID=A0AAD8JS35_TARER|nr:hypothetical protein QVD17_36124 [Tagetes erecta]
MGGLKQGGGDLVECFEMKLLYDFLCIHQSIFWFPVFHVPVYLLIDETLKCNGSSKNTRYGLFTQEMFLGSAATDNV